MDAKPYRPVRQASVLGNDNLESSAKPTIHQRHKSAGNLLSMASNGSLKVAAPKRNALLDSSNTKSLFPVSATGAAVKKNGNIGMNNSAIAKAQENSEAQVKPKDGLSRPAQRPHSKVGSIAHSTSLAPMRHVPSDPQAQQAPKQQFAFKRANKSVVYNDSEAEKDRQAPEPLNAGATIKTNRDHALNAAVDPAVHQPRHHRSYPALTSTLNSTQSGMRNQPTNAKNTALKRDRATFPATSEKPEWETALKRPSSTWELPGPAEKGSTFQRTKHADDDVTEATYLDAVEELPKGEHYAVPASIDAPIVAPQEPMISISAKDHAKVEAKAVDFEEDLHSVPADDPAEVSDYDEEFYDDQGYTTAHSNRSRGDNTTGATTIIFPPKVTKKDASELETAKLYVDSKRTPEEDAEEAWDVSMVAEYGDEIFTYMRELEMSMLPNAHYMDIQTEIQWSMRSVLMDWVIQVHCRFGLLPETLFLTVNYIDRFLSYKIVSLGKLQLVGATAIFVAAKYEEINCPSVQEVVYMVDGGYSIDEILKAERFMLSMLNFELGWPGPMSFLRRISKADDYDLESRTLSKYFLEVTLMDERFVASPPSYIAAGAHCLSRLILEKGSWSPAHVHYSGYTYAQLKPLVSMTLDCCRIARKHHSAVYEKYSDRKYKRVAIFVESQISKGFRLPFQSPSTQLLNCTPYWSDDAIHAYHGHGLKMPIPTEF